MRSSSDRCVQTENFVNPLQVGKGMKTRSRGQGRTAGIGFESRPLLLMIDEGDF
jgi:hypothetical protein